MKLKVSNVNYPNWRAITVNFKVPKEFEKLQEISKNLWWVWNYEATDLFKEIDKDLWIEAGGNPVLFLQKLNAEKYKELAKDKAILKKIDKIYADLKLI